MCITFTYFCGIILKGNNIQIRRIVVKEKTKNILGFFPGARKYFCSFFLFSRKKKILFIALPVFSFLLLLMRYHYADAFSQGEAEALYVEGMSMAASSAVNAVADSASSLFLLAFNYLLYAVWVFVSYLLVIAGIIFDWAIKPANFDLVVANNEAIYAGWKMVRDFLNLFFILVLLFSAFCTVFQVEKYHIKKLILTIVLMALLVNFSYPISRFIIDTANVTMYYMMGQLFPGGDNISIGVAKSFFNPAVLDPIKEGGSFKGAIVTTQIIGAIVFTFIFAVTMLMIGILLVVRLAVLGIVIIFSPLGFTANIFPSTQKYADDWWTALFKQSFFGPIMLFMVAIAINVYTASNEAISNSLQAAVSGTKTEGTLTGILITGVTLAIPITILWLGIMAAQKMGAIGADVAKKYSMAAVKGAALLPYKAAKSGLAASGITGGVKKRYENLTNKFKSAKSSREAKVASLLGDKGAEAQDMRRRAKEYKDQFTDKNTLKELAKKGDAAAALRLAEDKEIDQETYDTFVSGNGNPKRKPGQAVRDILDYQVKEKRAYLVAINKSNDIQLINETRSKVTASLGLSSPASDAQVKEYIANQEMGGLGPEKFAQQDWEGLNTYSGTAANKTLAQEGAKYAFGKMKSAAVSEVQKRINPNGTNALNNLGIPV